MLAVWIAIVITAMIIIGAMGLIDWAAEHRERGDCPECRRNQ
jgi:hypothetical protein